MKHLINAGIFSITILAMNLITGFITSYFMDLKKEFNPLQFTIIGMSALVVIFYPAFKYFDGQTKALTKRIVSKGKYLFGRTLGTFLIIALLLFALFCIYAYLWFGINVPEIIWKKLID